jgi:copper(I)-binding protein
MKLKISLFACLCLFGTSLSYAADVEIKDAWVRASVAGQQASGAFMTITSAKGATLTGISSPVATQAEVHEMKTENDVMKMRAVRRLDLPAGKAVNLNGDYHLMLMGLKKELKAGDTVPLTLQIEQAGKKNKITVNAEVRGLNSKPASEQHDDHQHHNH